MRKFIFIFLIGSTFILNAQNLVVNPSFEKYYSLPYLYMELDSFFCEGWYIPDKSSPDFFTKKSENKRFSVPQNAFGYSEAKTGDSYIGLSPIAWKGDMEHISGSLKEPLKKNVKYKVKFYIKYSGSSSKFYTSKFGIRFSSEKFQWNFLKIPFYNEILNPLIKEHVGNNNQWLNNPEIWQLIEGEYIATGGEQYFTLGIFYQNDWCFEKKQRELLTLSNTRKIERFYKKHQYILKLNPEYSTTTFSEDIEIYYYIDDVSVFEITKE